MRFLNTITSYNYEYNILLQINSNLIPIVDLRDFGQGWKVCEGFLRMEHVHLVGQ